MNAGASASSHEQAIVYIIDDDSSVRAALEDLLASVGLHSVSFGSTMAFLGHKMADAPGCLVLDIRMPGQSGMDFHRQMTELGIQLPTIFITGHGDIAMGVQAMKNGAIEFLTKPFRDQDLLDAIQHGIEINRQARAEHAVAAQLQKRWDSLTTGEQQVVQLVVQGLLNKQIAATLNLSEVTVKVRRGAAMRKMEAASLADLVKISEKLKI
ncbi:DNA-binding response regulator [Herminiimonas sp. KBW02]|uniref:response regulator transcription factor n=1 Tax=Herminiimonas sp. KBW02 TaxID=2153363 RepID=UPI000F593516|nr:response regulator [Herminiimonas sp. KBW02]RQO35782.1 DNA-binding response regulator [Herminiimonas sp. KBW02]